MVGFEPTITGPEPVALPLGYTPINGHRLPKAFPASNPCYNPAMKLNSIKGVPVKGKKVLMRADLNVPLDEGNVTDISRIEGIGPTLHHLLKEGALVYLASHLGRPKGEINPDFSLQQIITAMEQCLDIKVKFSDDCLKCQELGEGEVMLLENTRFYPEEKENDPEFAKKMAKNFDLFVNDAFGAAHRAHVSTHGITEHLPSYAGFLMGKEIEALSPLLEAQNVTLVLGGSKIDTKIGIVKNFLSRAKSALIGGALANTFLMAEGFDIGKSKSEEDKFEVAQETLLMADAGNVEIVLPIDVVVADEIGPDVQTLNLPVRDVELDMMILDVGNKSTEIFTSKIHEADTIIMNGPMGVYEEKPFEKSTKSVLEAIAAHKGTTILGGGDTVDAINKFNIPAEKFTHVSTGGGAMLEFLEGKTLPGIEPLII